MHYFLKYTTILIQLEDTMCHCVIFSIICIIVLFTYFSFHIFILILSLKIKTKKCPLKTLLFCVSKEHPNGSNYCFITYIISIFHWIFLTLLTKIFNRNFKYNIISSKKNNGNAVLSTFPYLLISSERGNRTHDTSL